MDVDDEERPENDSVMMISVPLSLIVIAIGHHFVSMIMLKNTDHHDRDDSHVRASQVDAE